MVTTKQVGVIAIIRRGRPTHFISQDRRICLWYQKQARVSNACMIKAAKLVDIISFKQKDKEYNLTEVFVDLDDSDASVSSDEEGLSTQSSAKALIAAFH